jgi:hypothetical protein
MSLDFDRIPDVSVNVLGVVFQAFIDPQNKQAVFSQRGTARALKMPKTSLTDIINSKAFKQLRGSDLPWARLKTTVSPTPISVVTQSDLILIVQIASEKGFPVAKSMQDASFAVLLQESVDRALGVDRDREEYIQAGTQLRLQLEYLNSYHSMKNTTFENGYGVRGLCKVNKQVSALAVPDADDRRQKSKFWRQNCSGQEKVKITIGNAVHEKAVEASTKTTLDNNLSLAHNRTSQIYALLDAPFPM